MPIIEKDWVVEGASKLYPLRVSGSSGYVDLSGYTLSGRLRSETDSAPVAVAGALASGDSTTALFALASSLSASKGGTIWGLEVEAANGATSYKKLWRIEFIKAWQGAGDSAVAGTPVENEIPGGAANGVNALFSLAHAPDPTSSLDFYVNGVLMTVGVDFTLAGALVTFQAASIPPPGATLLADYRYTSSSTPFTLVRLVDDETPAGTLDGVNAAFALAHTPVSGSLKLYVNGVRQTPGTHHTVSGSTITFEAGYIPESGDVLNADYRY
jgi:hypothetical protein